MALPSASRASTSDGSADTIAFTRSSSPALIASKSADAGGASGMALECHAEHHRQRDFDRGVPGKDVAIGVVLDADFRVDAARLADERADAHEILERED